MINKKRLLALAQKLIRINSENPPGDERAIARFVARTLKKAGLKPRVLRFYKQRDNVVCVYKGRKSAKPLLITPHLDTVPAGKGWSVGPFSGALWNGRIFGRGATDCKGNLAVAMEVLMSLAEDKAVLNHDVIFLATADEESGSGKGLMPFLKADLLKFSYAVVLDSDEFNIVTAQKGLIHFKVQVKGRKAHGAYPDRGINAIDRAFKLLLLLKNISWPHVRHRLLKAPTVNIGTIHGGDKVNMVPDWCEFEADLRFLPGMDAGRILSTIRGVFNRTKIPYAIHVHDIQQPYEIGRRHILVTSLEQASRPFVRRAAIKGSEGATVITFFQNLKIPAVATGYGSRGCAHATDEYVRLADLERGARSLENFVKVFDRRRS